MRLRNILKICLVFWKSEPRYAYKRYACKKNIWGMSTVQRKILILKVDCAVLYFFHRITLSNQRLTIALLTSRLFFTLPISLCLSNELL